MRARQAAGVLCIPAITALFGCATPYQQMGVRGGYTDHEVSENVYFISFEGNGYTSASAVASMWHRRAREVCGGEYGIVHRDGNSDMQLISVNGQPTTVTRHRVEGYVKCLGKDEPSPRVMASSTQQPQQPVADTPPAASVLGWRCFFFSAADGTNRTMCGQSNALCLGIRSAVAEGLRSRGSTELPTECAPAAQAYCTVTCDAQTGACARTCFQSEVDCAWFRATYPDAVAGFENVPSQACAASDLGSPPPGEGWGWWCGALGQSDSEICLRTQRSCSTTLRAACHHVASAACFSYVLTVQEDVVFSCHTSMEACNAQRGTLQTSADVTEISACGVRY